MARESYFDQLKFDPRLLKTPIGKYLTNFRLVLLLIIAIVVSGIFSFLNLPRRLNPEVKIPIVSVSTVLPGAGPEEVEKLITVPIEDEIAGLEGVAKINSNSQENVSVISVEFDSGFDPDRAKDNVKSAVDSVGNLPSEAQTPNVQKLDFENQPVWQFLVTTDSDSASLEQFADELKEKIENVASVKSAQITGIEEQEIQILVSQNNQRVYNLNPAALAQAIKSSLRSLPAGNVNTGSSTFILTIDPTITSVKDLRNLQLNVDGRLVRLGDIATIVERSKPQTAKSYVANSQKPAQKAVAFSIFKSESVNIDKAVEDVRKVTDDQIAKYNGRFELISTQDFANLIDEQFKELEGSFRDTIILVIIVLLVFLGIRQALIVAFAIPLSFLVAFTVMRVTGISLNFLSSFSLILALGLLVDDAIVVVTAVTAYWRTKKFTPNQTGLLVLHDFIVPIWSTTITAVWAFLPILIASGLIGEFIKSMPIVVSATLLASTAIAILVTLPLMMIALKPQIPNRLRILLLALLALLILALVTIVTFNNPLLPLNLAVTFLIILITIKLRREFAKSINKFARKFIDTRRIETYVSEIAQHGLIDSQKYAHKYQNLIDRVLASKNAQNKTLIIVVLFAVFSYLLLPLGFVVNEFFPETDQENIYISAEMPPGTNLDTSDIEAKLLLEDLRKTPETKYVTAETSRSISATDFFGAQPRQNNILFTLVLPKESERNKGSIEIAHELREKYRNYSKGKFSVVELSGGPPAGAELQITLSGEDLKTLDQYASEITDFLSSQPGTTNIEKSSKAGAQKIVFIPDRDKLSAFGLTQDAIGTQLRTAISGFELDSDVDLNGTTNDIVYRNTDTIESPKNLPGIFINTPQGSTPVSALGNFALKPNPTQITREDQKRTLAVTAGLTQGYTPTVENKKLEDFAKSLNLPEGYSWKTEGVNEENQKSVNSIFQAMLISFVLIATTMVLQFSSFRKAFIVLLLIPLAISGVFIVFALTHTPLSFPTLIGMLALFGIVVYQSMILVDKIGKNVAIGMKLKPAISDAAASRVEPILFGTITTVVGLIPISLSDPLWRGLGGAIIAGMFFSGIIMLLFIPIVYYKIFQKDVR